jgi:hypothetical protein
MVDNMIWDAMYRPWREGGNVLGGGSFRWNKPKVVRNTLRMGAVCFWQHVAGCLANSTLLGPEVVDDLEDGCHRLHSI